METQALLQREHVECLLEWSVGAFIETEKHIDLGFTFQGINDSIIVTV